jgi:hypothetical protein
LAGRISGGLAGWASTGGSERAIDMDKDNPHGRARDSPPIVSDGDRPTASTMRNPCQARV